MSKTAAQQIEEIRAAADAKIEALKRQAIAELKQALKTAEAEVERLKKDLAEIEGPGAASAQAMAKRITRLPKLEEGSEEWNKIAEQIRIVLRRYPDGLNGKTIANKLGKTEPNEIKRVQTVVQATCRREGEGVLTRFFAS
jgi:uncharacterized protein involved in exopolysaccharide biosynthesis